MFEMDRPGKLLMDFEAVADTGAAMDNTSARMQYQKFLRSAVRNLPVPQRQTVILYYYKGYRLTDIAQELSIAPSTAMRRLRAAQKKLRELARVFWEAGLFSH